MGWKRRTQNQWQRLVEDWERSGLTQAAYCRKKDISVASLQRWKRLLADDDRSAAEHIRGQVPSQTFLPVRLVERPELAAGADLTVVPVRVTGNRPANPSAPSYSAGVGIFNISGVR